jgi:excinuclease ABC subunit A
LQGGIVQQDNPLLPEGGEAGGRLVAVGTPEDVAAVEASHTGRHLAEVLRGAGRAAVGEGA